MHQQTIRIILYSSLAVVLLAFVWGFHEIPAQGRLADQVLRESLDQEMIVLNGAVKASLEAMKYRLLDVLKAEGNDHPTRAFQDSPFLAATLLEWDQEQVHWKSLWYSVKSKTDLQGTELKQWMAEWPLSKLEPESVYLSKVGMVQGQAYFAILVSVRKPNQVPMIGVGLFPASQFGLSFSASENRDYRVFNDQGYALALSRPAYLGSSLRSETMAGAILDSDEVGLAREWKAEHGVRKIGLASRVSDSNLFVAIESKTASGFAFQSWLYLLLCACGAAALNWVLFGSILRPLLSQLSQSEQTAEQLRRQNGAKVPAAEPVYESHIESPRLETLDFQETASTADAATMVEEPAAPSLVSLEKIVQAALRAFHGRIQELHVRVNTLGLKDSAVDVDPLQLQTAIEEILKNACEAMQESETRLLTVSVTETKEKICLSIEDTGCGIQDADLGKVFDPFFSTKDSQGVARGLGLNVVRRVIEEISGTVKLHSPAGVNGGTRVEIEWPRERESNVSTAFDSVAVEPSAEEIRFSLDDVADEMVAFEMVKVPTPEWKGNPIRRPKVRTLD